MENTRDDADVENAKRIIEWIIDEWWECNEVGGGMCTKSEFVAAHATQMLHMVNTLLVNNKV